MPLNRNGEALGQLGKGRVAENARWRDTQFFEEAARHAEEVFFQSGALLPVDFEDQDVLIQEYDVQKKVVFIFCKKVSGEELIYPFTFDLTDEVITELRMADRWGYQH